MHLRNELSGLLADVRYSSRRLRNSPGFSVVVILSLAVGIGASSALFSLVNAAVLRMIPVREPRQLVWFDSGSHGRALSYPFYEHIRGDPRFEGILCAFATTVNISVEGAAERTTAELVSANYFEVLGLRPVAGRLLTGADARTPVAVVSHAYWQSRLRGAAGVVGTTIRLNGTAWTIAGVAPPGFGGLDRAYQRSIFVPMGMKPQVTPGWNGLDKPLIAWVHIAGRLKPGVDYKRLGPELNSRFQAFQELYLPSDVTLSAVQRQIIRGRWLHLKPLGSSVFEQPVTSNLSLLGWMTGLLLGLTCLNVAGILLARGMERTRETATRIAVGCSRQAVVRQLLVESALLASAGGITGVMAAAIVAPILASRYPITGAASQLDVPVDLAVLGFGFGISLLACLAFGLMPAWQATKIDLVAGLKGAGAAPSASQMRSVLLFGQVTLSVVLLGAAGFLVTHLRSLLTQNSGFDRQRLLLAEVEPALSGYDEAGRLRFYRELQGRLDALAGPATYSAAVMANVAPRSPHHWSSGFEVAGRGGGGPSVRAVAVGPGYFEAMRIPLRSGRLLNERDETGAARVAVISESLARREFPEESPLGRRFTADMRSPKETTFEIVGIVGDVNLTDPRKWVHRECVFFPYRQWAFPPQSIVLHARLAGTGSPAAAVHAFRTAVRSVDPSLALFDIRTIEQATGALLVAERLTSFLTVFFAAAAALLCALGIYGVVSRELVARTRETAIRVALGGRFAVVVLRIARGPIFAAVSGLAGGIVMLLFMGPVMGPLLNGTRLTLPLIAGSVIAVGCLAAVAVVIPAAKARRMETSTLLRRD
ncbi:MAG: ABC transporter permease [Bryobacterales bacterium]|nr:ABC transporter permease [Bryobacterales bacterium]